VSLSSSGITATIRDRVRLQIGLRLKLMHGLVSLPGPVDFGVLGLLPLPELGDLTPKLGKLGDLTPCFGDLPRYVGDLIGLGLFSSRGPGDLTAE